MTVDLKKYIEAGESFLLVGPPGIGKTARLFDAANRAGYRVEVMRASLSERVDFGGALVPDRDIGVTRALPLELLHQLKKTKEPTVLFLDDLGQAPMDVQAACMGLFDKGFLSDNVLICGATNRPGDKAGVMGLCEPLRSRFSMSFSVASPEPNPGDTIELSTWSEEVQTWCDWAATQQAAPEIIAYHHKTGGAKLYEWSPNSDPAIRMPDYRSWHTVIRLWSKGITDTKSVAAAIGFWAASDFKAFADLSRKIPSVQEIFERPDKALVPEEPSPLYLVATSTSLAVTGSTTQAFMKYINRMPDMYGILSVRSAYRRGGTISQALSKDPAFCEYIKDKEDILIMGVSS